MFLLKKHARISFKVIAALVAFVFVVGFAVSDLFRAGVADASVAPLPPPTQMVSVSSAADCALLKGMRFDATDPMKMTFVFDAGSAKSVDTKTAQRLIRYFLASLTVREDDMWVNLSPFEKERVIPEQLAVTDMGHDMLAQDYLLKQLASSLTYPNSETGKAYWKGIGASASDAMNKVWITPDVATVYENKNLVLVTDATLKVLTEQDYLAQQKSSLDKDSAALNAVRASLIPSITKDVNTGKNFVALRQIYFAQVLATWFKERIKEQVNKDKTLWGQYADSNIIGGIDNVSAATKQKIYERYLEAYTKGVYSLMKGDSVQTDKKRRYFSGGYHFNKPQERSASSVQVTDDLAKRTLVEVSSSIETQSTAVSMFNGKPHVQVDFTRWSKFVDRELKGQLETARGPNQFVEPLSEDTVLKAIDSLEHIGEGGAAEFLRDAMKNKRVVVLRENVRNRSQDWKDLFESVDSFSFVPNDPRTNNAPAANSEAYIVLLPAIGSEDVIRRSSGRDAEDAIMRHAMEAVQIIEHGKNNQDAYTYAKQALVKVYTPMPLTRGAAAMQAFFQPLAQIAKYIDMKARAASASEADRLKVEENSDYEWVVSQVGLSIMQVYKKISDATEKAVSAGKAAGKTKEEIAKDVSVVEAAFKSELKLFGADGKLLVAGSLPDWVVDMHEKQPSLFDSMMTDLAKKKDYSSTDWINAQKHYENLNKIQLPKFGVIDDPKDGESDIDNPKDVESDKVKQDRVLAKLQDGKVNKFFMFGGAASRLKKDLKAIGLDLSDADSKQAALKVWDVVSRVKELDIEKIKEALDVYVNDPKSGIKPADREKEKNGYLALVNKIKDTDVPFYARKNMPWGSRFFEALSVGFDDLAKKTDLDASELNEMKKKFGITVQVSGDVQMLTEEVLRKNKYFGFSPEKIVFAMDSYGVALDPARKVAVPSSPQPWSHGYGFSTLFFTSGYTLVGKTGRSFRGEAVMDDMIKQGYDLFVTSRVNDAVPLLPSQALDFDFLKYAYSHANDAVDVIYEQMQNFTGTKGGLPASLDGQNLYMLETLDMQTKAMIAVQNRMKFEALQKKWGGAPYNRLYAAYKLGNVKNHFDRVFTKGRGEISMSYKDVSNGDIAPELPTTNITQDRELKSKGATRNHDALIDDGILVSPLLDPKKPELGRMYDPAKPKGMLGHDAKTLGDVVDVLAPILNALDREWLARELEGVLRADTEIESSLGEENVAELISNMLKAGKTSVDIGAVRLSNEKKGEEWTVTVNGKQKVFVADYNDVLSQPGEKAKAGTGSVYLKTKSASSGVIDGGIDLKTKAVIKKAEGSSSAIELPLAAMAKDFNKLTFTIVSMKRTNIASLLATA